MLKIRLYDKNMCIKIGQIVFGDNTAYGLVGEDEANTANVFNNKWLTVNNYANDYIVDNIGAFDVTEGWVIPVCFVRNLIET